MCFMCMHLNICAFRHIHSRKSKLRTKYKSQIYQEKKKSHFWGNEHVYISETLNTIESGSISRRKWSSCKWFRKETQKKSDV